VAEDISPAEKAGAFLIRLRDADRKEFECASSAVRSDQPTWKAAGVRVAEIVASKGLDEQKARLCRQAAAIFEGKAAQIQPGDRQFALWAAQGVIVGLLAGGSATRADLRLLCRPFAQLLREPPVPAPGENGYCQTHPRVPLTYGGCHVCRRGDDKRYSRW
jgi:hypothetical protein